MAFNIAGIQSGQYTVHTPVYEGPLALLLDLIERAELDITSLSLALVTDQYLAYIRALEELEAEEISAFLVIAAKLLQIKSEALLPRPPVREPGEEDPAEVLAEQLRVYKRFKEIAVWLNLRSDQNLRTYLRLAPPPKIAGRLDLSDISLADLQAAAEAILGQQEEKAALASVIAAPRVTIREKIALIAGILQNSQGVTFSKLIGEKPSRLEVVVTFLALLELVKRFRVSARQDGLFHEIEIQMVEKFNDQEDLELEFE